MASVATGRPWRWCAELAAGPRACPRRCVARRSAVNLVRVANHWAYLPRYGLDMGETYESVTIDTKDHVAQVTLVGPGKGNAMGPAFWAEMPEVFAKLDADQDVRAIVLTGSGKNFSYGLDLPAMGGSLSGVLGGGGSARPRADFHQTILRMQGAINA